MKKVIKKAVVITLMITCVNSHVAFWNNPKKLQPVQGLYVKPSSDGTTGDLYVAATEDSGVKAQWLTDQPVNFLPVTAATQQSSPPVALTPSFPTVQEENATNLKRAVGSQPVQYAYAIPVPTSSEGMLTPYPYLLSGAHQVPKSSSEHKTTPCTSAVPHYSPFQFFYPQMMSAYSNALTVLKDAGMSEDTASSVMSQTSPLWSTGSYGYPMYVMMDPNAWAQTQPPITTPATSETVNENLG